MKDLIGEPLRPVHIYSPPLPFDDLSVPLGINEHLGKLIKELSDRMMRRVMNDCGRGGHSGGGGGCSRRRRGSVALVSRGDAGGR